MEVECIDEVAGFERLREEWTAVLAARPVKEVAALCARNAG